MKALLSLLLLGGWGWAPQDSDVLNKPALLREAHQALWDYCGERQNRGHCRQPGQPRIGLLAGPIVVPDHHSLHRSLPTPDSITIEGLVQEATGGIIPGATVRCLSQQGELLHTTISGDSGRFSFPPLPPGPYQISAAFSGFKQALIEFEPQGTPMAPLRLRLEIGPSSEVVVQHLPERAGGPRDLAVTLLSLEQASGFLPFAVLRTQEGSRVLTRSLGKGIEAYSSQSEWLQDLARSRKFYEVALDLPGGPQRLAPYLQNWAAQAASHSYLQLRDLTEDEQPLFIAAAIDIYVVSIWRQMEDLPAIDLLTDPPVEGASQHLHYLLDKVAAGRDDLEALGAFQPQHLDTLRPFLEARLGMFSLHREQREPFPDEPPRLLVAFPVGPWLIYLDADSDSLEVESLLIDD
ncbi:MAG TPA: carboxypeptidase-like regulatory domain-containing protein [Acidobacteriota bacterium]|nr:carboxypeptidase-like regulatory domain-containing protein [Acidobacteriota bacterium]